MTLRKEKGWSQGYLAKQSGVSRKMIGKYERGEAVPSIETAKKIASALGVTLACLAGEASSAAFDRRTVERIQDIEQLDEGEKQHVFDLLDTFLAKNKMQAILK
ncbi:helix-turn-helix transcriptional regulator [Sphingobacterium olei]|uniref:Helix-turn-helix transcriptional regulator n=1 Tax=Sphingobacterium olei TaxID=2571155 RepID=A0A4V5MJM3_9SPHI|nr:helix-turn-helix transcriptional regulator [Sphingobacterium olei]